MRILLSRTNREKEIDNSRNCFQGGGKDEAIEMSHRFSERVKRVLQNAGWYERRCVEVTGAVQALEKIGIIASPQVGLVLQEFHGLKIKGYRPYSFSMSEILTGMVLKEEDVYFLNKLIDETLCPFGCGESVLLLIAVSGKCVILHDEWISYHLYENLGDCLESAFFLSDKRASIRIADEQKPRNYR
jgi:hypothetical protein